MMYRVLRVSRSSYYWLKAPDNYHNERTKALKSKILEAYFNAKGCYGSPRIKEELCRTGTQVSAPTVAKYMKEMGLKSKLTKKNTEQQQTPITKNQWQKCVSDIT